VSHPTPLPTPDAALPPIARLREIVAALRSPGGCPWDREQTHASLRGALLEEAHEVVDAMNRNDDPHLSEELGDLLLQVVFHAQIATEEERFTFDDVARAISEKLIRRHPHVFGDDQCEDSAAVLKRWDEIKHAEKGGTQQSALDGIPQGLPALMRATKLQKKAAKIGFDWENASPVLGKVREELAEIETEIASGDREKLEDELGDLLFTAVNLARKLHIDAEVALHRASAKFERRFREVEHLASKRSLALATMSLPELDALWDEVKARETKRPNG